MRRIAIIGCLALSFSGTALAGKKKKKKGKEPAPAPSQEPSPEIPGDGVSKKFSKTLMGTPLKHFRPIDQLKYDALTFKGDNTWTAAGTVFLGLEEDTCTESGTWTMETAEADNAAVVNWVVVETSCVGRAVGAETRALLTINKDGNYDVRLRCVQRTTRSFGGKNARPGLRRHESRRGQR